MPALDTSSPHGMKERKTGKGRLRSFEFRNPSFSLLPSLLLSLYLSGLVSCDSCRDALRHSEYAAGARWVWPHRLVITVQHQTPNYQLTPEPTPTCLKAQWPTPPSVCSIPHSTNPPTAPQPSSVLSKHAPWDASWHHDIQMLRDIRPHLCVSVRLSDPWTLQKRRKSICLCSFRAERGYNSVSFRG